VVCMACRSESSLSGLADSFRHGATTVNKGDESFGRCCGSRLFFMARRQPIDHRMTTMAWTMAVAAFIGYVALVAYAVGLLQWALVRLPRQGRVAGDF